jgi:Protein kinase domain
MMTEAQRTCPSCGNEFAGTMEFCPVCMFRGALPGATESGASTFEVAVKPTPDQSPKRFDHYELVIGEDGKPVELGRGAMGVTYKAFDINLRCPVTLKVINERYLGDESARLRFLREARVAASIRHQNVASVLHLGRTGQNYFYAMELVEGETLQTLYQTRRMVRDKVGAGNCEAGGYRIGRSSRTEPCPPGYQADKHHGKAEGGRLCNGQNHRPRLGEDSRRIGF